MKEKIYMDENLFDLSVLVGNWESVNLNPTIIIYRNDNSYLLSVIHMNETSRQASPATYEIQEDEDGFFINYNLKRMAINYDNKLDILTLSIIRKTKCFDFWERNVLFPKTKRSFFRTPKHPLPCPFPLNFSLLIITKKFGNLAKNRYICIV